MGLLDGGLSVERVLGVDLGRDTAGDNVKDGLAELDEETVNGSVDLGLDVTALLLAELDSGVDELGVGGELGRGEAGGLAQVGELMPLDLHERGVGGGVLGLVGGNGLEVARVRDDNGARAVVRMALEGDCVRGVSK